MPPRAPAGSAVNPRHRPQRRRHSASPHSPARHLAPDDDQAPGERRREGVCSTSASVTGETTGGASVITASGGASSSNFPYEAVPSPVENSTGIDLTPTTTAAGQRSSAELHRRADRLCWKPLITGSALTAVPMCSKVVCDAPEIPLPRAIPYLRQIRSQGDPFRRSGAFLVTAGGSAVREPGNFRMFWQGGGGALPGDAKHRAYITYELS